MEEAKHDRAGRVRSRLFCQYVADDGRPVRMFGHGFLAGPKKLVTTPRRMAEHPHLVEKIREPRHGVPLFELFC